MNSEIFLLLSAESTHLIMKLDHVLKEHSIPARVIPLPTEIKASCGLSIKTDLKYLQEIHSICIEENIEISYFTGEKVGFKKTFIPLTF